MGTLYRRRRRQSDGATVRDDFYTLAYYDADGKRRTARGYSDKRASQEKLRRLEERAARKKEGLPVPPAEGEEGRSWRAAVAAYRADLERQGRTARYLDQAVQELHDLAAWCRWDRLHQMRPDRLTEFLAHVREHGLSRPPLKPGGRARPGRPASPRTCNAYRDAAVSFVSWCMQQGWIEANPLARVPKATLGAPGDLSRRPRARRALTIAEFSRLVACPRIKLWRRRLYEAAGLSGLRGKELHQLAPFDFTLSERPRWHLRPEVTKAKRLDTVPMLPECATLLAELAAGKEAMDRLFPTRPHHRTVAADLKRAGIPLRDHRGRYANFHSLRYFFCGLLAGVLPIQQVRVLMRHQDIRTTIGLYLDLGFEDLAEKLTSLPALFDAARRAAVGAARGSGAASA